MEGEHEPTLYLRISKDVIVGYFNTPTETEENHKMTYIR